MSLSGSVETSPRGSQPETIAVGEYRYGRASDAIASRHEPGPKVSPPRSSRYVAPAERSSHARGSPLPSVKPSKSSPAEWATMNHGGVPHASSAPIIDPADVPTM